jgi:hypothetical protein
MARVYVNFNDMLSEKIVLLSSEDIKTDSEGNVVTFTEERQSASIWTILMLRAGRIISSQTELLS